MSTPKKGMTIINFDENGPRAVSENAGPEDIHNAIADAVGEPRMSGRLVLCRSDSGDGGWSLHPPGSTDEQIANGTSPCLSFGPAAWSEDAQDWDRPNSLDYHHATEAYFRWKEQQESAS